MPLNTETMVMQNFENWFFRMLLLIIVGVFSGVLFSLLEDQLDKVNQIAYYDPETELPNKTKLKDDLEIKIKSDNDFHIFILSINNFTECLDQAVKFNQVSIFNDITLGVSIYPNQSRIAGELMDQAFIALEKADKKKL